MPSLPPRGAAFFLLLALTGAAPAAEPPTFARDVRPLLDAFCARCHGEKKPRGGVDLASVLDEKSFLRQGKLARRVLEQVRSGEMPPAKQQQPTRAQRDRLVEWLDGVLRAGNDPGPTLARRLTRTEYERTLRDLVGIDFNSSEAVGMPDDAEAGGFDNLARRLTLAPAQMEKYFAAADRILERVLGLPDGKPAGGGFNRHQAQEAAKKLLFVVPSAKVPDTDAARQVIARFARLAYRRPVTDGEIDRLMRLYQLARKKGDSHVNGLRLMLKAVLVSPHFLLRDLSSARPEGAGKGVVPVSDHELASRLSYFLWSTMPDEGLRKLADEGRLSAPGLLEQQVRRMLRDGKAWALTNSFGVPWLQAGKVWHARPSQEDFPAFNNALRGAMYSEVVTFFNKLREDDRSVLDLLDADYTYANEVLARHYGLEGVTGPQMRRVALRPGDRRGGLLGMAGILTMTSHTSRTSPTLRGKWVLDVIFGTPTPPPPPDAGLLKEEKQKGKEPRTFRELLAAHAAQPACAACHRKMDPLGYALDNFDAIGRWRDSDGTRPLDTSGVLPGGQRVNGPAELKRIVLGRKDDFLRNLAEQMLVYALGRELQHFDEPAVREVTAELARGEYRFSVLVGAIVKSYPFRHRRNSGDE
jgi:hypothetical protein